MLCLVRYLWKEVERYCYHVSHFRNINVFPKLVYYLTKNMDICYCSECTVISLPHNLKNFVRHNNRHHEFFEQGDTWQMPVTLYARWQRFLPVLYLSLRRSYLPVCCLVSCLTICLFKGVRFKRNCGAASVGKNNKLVWFYQMGW